MQITREELNQFVDKLSDVVTEFDSTVVMLSDLESIAGSDKIEYLNYFPAFFGNVIDSFIRKVIIEIVILFDEPDRSKTGIKKMLRLASSYVINHGKSDQDIEMIKEFIDKSNKEMESISEIFEKIKSQRDKVWAHRDRRYFDDPNTFFRETPVLFKEIRSFAAIAKNILTDAVSVFLKVSREIRLVNSDEAKKLVEIIIKYRKLRDEQDKAYLGR